jgi:pyruvate dehydrogenase E2 component (dihydrolipoamide acetyltransferase)
MLEGTLVEWRIAPGRTIKRGEVIALIETDKGIIDVEAFHDGVVERLLVQPGTRVPVGQVLALLEGHERLTPASSDAAHLDARLDEALWESFPASDAPAVHTTDRAAGRQIPPAAVLQASAAISARARAAISPAARKRAQALGVPIDTIAGTGPGGAIALDDVERAAAAQRTPAPGVARGMRHAIAAAMTRAKREIPHYYLSHTMDFEPADSWLKRFNASRPVEDRLLYPALAIKAVALATRDVPGFNGHYGQQGFLPKTEAHVGFVIAQRGGGLVAPAILDAAAKDTGSIMRELKDLVARARQGHLRSSEVTSPTITITSLGEEGVDAVYPIIFPDQVAIVGIGRVAERPWVIDGKVVPRPVLNLTLAADHRVSDGRAGARFLARIAALLATPDHL